MNTNATSPTSPSHPTSPMAQKRRGLGTKEKVVLGCALGCGGLILLAVLAGVGGFYWLVSPGEQVATERIVTPESTGAVQLRRTLEDPGVTAFAENLLREITEVSRRQQQEEMPESMRWMQSLQGDPTQGLKMWMPKEVAFTVEPDPDTGDPHWVTAVNLRSFPRLIRTMIGMMNQDQGSGEVVKIPYGEYTIERMGGQDPTFLSFVGGTLVVSDDLFALERTLDRLALPEAAEAAFAQPAAAAELGLGEGFAEQWDLTAVFANPEDRYGVILREWLANEARLEPELGPEAGSEPAPPPTEQLRAFGGGVDLVDADAVQAELHLAFEPGAEAAREAWRIYLEETFHTERWQEEDSALRPELQLDPRGADGLVARLTVRGLETWARRLAEGLEGHSVEVTGNSDEGVAVEVE